MSRTQVLRRKRALNAYIDSYGETLPHDWYQFTVGNTSQNDCPFCTDEHCGYPIPVMDPLRNKIHKDDLGIFACRQCAQHVDIMLSTVYGMESNLETYPDKEDDRKGNRLNLLLQTLRFAPEVYLYYTHLHTTQDRYVLGHPNQCYLCDSKDLAGFKIKVPVSHSGEVSGGDINICTDCEYDLRDIDVLYQSLLTKAFIYREHCPVCQGYYYIDENELDYRTNLSKVPMSAEWACPECTYKQINNLSQESKLYSFENAIPRQDVALRFIQCNCFSCVRPFSIDLSITHTHIQLRNFVTPDKLICHECAEQGIKSFLNNRLVVHIADNVYIKMKFAIFWDYEVIRLKKGESAMELILTATTEEEEIAEAVSIAINELYKLKGGNQLKIW